MVMRRFRQIIVNNVRFPHGTKADINISSSLTTTNTYDELLKDNEQDDNKIKIELAKKLMSAAELKAITDDVEGGYPIVIIDENDQYIFSGCKRAEFNPNLDAGSRTKFSMEFEAEDSDVKTI